MIAYSQYATDPRIRREAEALTSRGDHVDCICLQPSIMQETKVLNGVHICPLNIARYQGARSRSYLLSYLRFLFKASLKVAWDHIVCRYDVVQVHTMPDFMVFAALLPKLLGAKVVLDVHDLVPELYMSKFHLRPTHPIVKALMWIEVISVRFADKAISVHKTHLDALVSHGNNANRFEIILNTPDPAIFKYRRREKRDDHFNIVYHGTVSKRHGIELSIRAAMLALPKIPNLRFSIIGAGDNLAHVKQLVRDLDIEEYVSFLPLVPVDKLPALLECADVGVISLSSDVFTEFMLPLKLMEYVALGVPCIATRTRTIEAYFDDSMVQFIDGRDEAELSECLVRLYQNPSQRERLAAKARSFTELHNWDQEKRIYYRLVDSLVR
jgi:glycosyltransferase involved in cell wall biosynthesis